MMSRVHLELGRIQARQRSRAGAKCLSFNTQTLQNGNKQIGQRFVVVSFECKMLAVPESASGQHNGQISVVVRVGVAHVAAVKNHGLVE